MTLNIDHAHHVMLELIGRPQGWDGNNKTEAEPAILTTGTLRRLAELQGHAPKAFDLDATGSGDGTTSQAEAGLSQDDLKAAADALGTLQDIERLTIILNRLAPKLRSINPARQTMVECRHCGRLRKRDNETCACGVDPKAIRCANPNHDAYLTPGHDTIRVGRCQPCHRYWDRHDRQHERPADLCSKTEAARRTGDTKTMQCANPHCDIERPYRELRDGRCRECHDFWCIRGSERLTTAAMALGDNVQTEQQPAA